MASAFEALHCFLQQPSWVSLCLRGNSEDGLSMPILDLHAACSRMDAPLRARLTAGACLTQLCRAEEVRQHQPGLTVQINYHQQALSNSSMAVLVDVMEQAVKVSLSLFNCYCEMLCVADATA